MGAKRIPTVPFRSGKPLADGRFRDAQSLCDRPLRPTFLLQAQRPHPPPLSPITKCRVVGVHTPFYGPKKVKRSAQRSVKTDCETSSQRLDDIAHQLEDAIEDWRRFVAANCKGVECQRIFQELQERQRALYHDVVEQYIDKTLRNTGPNSPTSVNNSQSHQTPVSESQDAIQEPNPPQSDSVLVE
jgi:hypothetical protein